jgi:hypothetical protein
MRRMMILTTTLLLALAGVAQAQDTSITATLTPSTPKAASTFGLTVSGAAPELSGGTLPDAIALGLQRGFVLDTRAVSTRCAGAAATNGACPSASSIGSGEALVHTSGFVTADIRAALSVFLAAPLQAGDFASVVLRVDVAGTSRAVRARLVKLASGPFGYVLQVEGFAGTVPALPGVTLELRNLTLNIGAKRRVTVTSFKRTRVTRNGKRVTVRRKIKRKVTRTLIQNPKTCATGSWAARVTVRVAGSNRVRDVSVACSKA